MAKKGKDFKIPDNLFDKKFWTTFEAVAVNEYRKVIFDKSNPRMSNANHSLNILKVMKK